MEKLYEQRISTEQKEVLLDFMISHPEFSKTKLLGVEGRKTKNALWAVLTEQINACEGPSKPVEKWQRVWADLKTKTKRKASDIKASRSKTGGGPACPQTLNTFDIKLLNLLSEEAVHGLEGPDGVPLDSEELVDEGSVTRTLSISSVPTDSGDDHISRPSTPGSFEEMPACSNASTPVGFEETMSQTTVRHGRKRKRSQTDPLGRFIEMNQAMNDKLDKIGSFLAELVEEKKRIMF
ncbi:hypothetical protein FQR65_LT14048 [Abscondita terminalis]|nr:hypothetical protein FQR65_LT14048 [Abscondita terminalis]